MKKDRVILIITTSIIALVLFFLIDRDNIGNSVETAGFEEDINSGARVEKPSRQAKRTRPQLENFQLKDIEGNLVSLEDYRGKTVFINFWASWSEESVQALREFEKLNQEEDIQVLSINVREDYKAIEKFLADKDLDLKILLDKDGNMGLDYVVGKLPTTYIVNRQGELIEKLTGPVDLESMLEKIEDEY